MSNSLRAALAGLALAALSADARVDPRPIAPAPAVQRGEHRFEEPAIVDLIVRFRGSAPLRGQMQANAINARRREVEARVAELRRDVEGAQIGRTFFRVFEGASIRVPRAQRDFIRALPYVASVHRARMFQPMESGAKGAALKAAALLPHSRGAGVVVAVIDSGIDYLHPALGGGFGTGFKVIGGWDFANEDGDPMDDYGHGTHVAGIIAADGAGLVGVAPDVSLVAYKVISSGGFATVADVLAAVERTVDPDQNGDPADHVDIVNMSLGGPADDDDPVVAAIEAATAAGVLFCIANGNGGDYGHLPSPAWAPSAISAGAVNANGATARFSTRGPSYTYAIKPEIAAPGVDILSTIPGGGTIEASGTSMASPYVAGVAALVKSQHEEWTPAEIKSAVITSAASLTEEVMAAGVGRADPIRAEAVSTLASPAVLSFGKVDPQQPVWTASQTVTLRNVSAAQQTLTATVTGIRDGVEVRVTPKSVTLASGESKTVTVELKVTNSAVPAPRNGSLSFGGLVRWNDAVHVPWAFVKGTFLVIDEQSHGLVTARVLGSETSYGTDDFIGRTHVFWPFEKVDVVATLWSTPDLIAVAEDVDLEKTSQVSLDVDTAVYTIAADTTGPDGAPLDSGDRECYEHVVLGFPSGRKVAYDQYAMGSRDRYSRLSPRVSIYVEHLCADMNKDTMYAAIHEPMHGLEADVTSTLRPQWLRQDVRFEPNVADGMTIATIGTRFPGPAYSLSAPSSFLMRGAGSDLTMFITPKPAPEVDYVAFLERWSRCYEEELGHDVDCPMMDNIYVYLDEQSVAIDTDIFEQASPMAYRLPIGTPLTIGHAPVSPRTFFLTVKGYWGAQTWWMGTAGERLMRNTIDGSVALYDAAGTLLGKERVGIEDYVTLPPGRYRTESIDTSSRIAGVPVRATFTGWTDTTRTDRLLPLFTGLRIVDENERQAMIVGRDTRASLLFSVADVADGTRTYFRRIAPRENATRVEYRAHGGAAWHPLPALVTARQYEDNGFTNGGIGTVYRVDLASVTSAITGLVDLHIFAEDVEGNTSELLLEPAFSVDLSLRKRVVRH